MKLYSEEQVRTILDLAKLNVYGTKIYSKDELIEQQKPIELPSDEEIRNQTQFATNDYYFGAIWMKKLILKQNK